MPKRRSCIRFTATSVLDLNCKAHDLDNLYVVDGGFMVSSAAVNPTLTIIANALRVGDHLVKRLGARATASASSIVMQGRADTRVPLEVAMAK